MNIKILSLGPILMLGLLVMTLVNRQTSQTVRAQTAVLTWYVDGNCTVCGVGTVENPTRTINSALTSAADGDTILIAQGTYVEHLRIGKRITLMGGFAPTAPTWTRDINRYETILLSDDRTTPGDWDGDWLGSLSIIKNDAAYRMWYSAGNEIEGDSIGYADSPDAINWFKPVRDSLLKTGPLSAWDEASVANPTIIAIDGGFQMWYVGLNILGDRAIGFAASPDGLIWEKHTDNPVLSPDTPDETTPDHPTVIRNSPTDYKLWYSSEGKIWLATSSDGLAWTKYLSTPALEPGPSGAWDDDQVYAPHVIFDSNRYEMWYVGLSQTTSEARIGYAWSNDGLTWIKSTRNPVLVSIANTWEGGAVTYPLVIKEGPTNYKMWYRGGSSNNPQAFGQATSPDGAVWTKYSSNPIMNQGIATHWGDSTVFFGTGSDGAVLDGLKITGGYAEYGGGIQIYQASPIIRNCTVTGNTAHENGGGIWLGDGAPTIENTIVSSNTSIYAGAGIGVSYASPLIQNSLIEGNTAKYLGGGLMIWGQSQSLLTATTITGNTAQRGGGLNLGDNVNLRAYGCKISRNIAAQSAGVQASQATLALTNTFIVDNAATDGGPGAMRLWRSSGKLVNVTIAGNSASDGTGGIFFSTGQPGTGLVITNSIFAFNGNNDLDCSEDGCTVAYSDVQERIAGQGNISANPRFVNQAGGDYHLRGSSPAIDVGTDAGAPLVDFDGDPRTDEGIDMGADEFTGEPFKDEYIYLPLLFKQVFSYQRSTVNL